MRTWSNIVSLAALLVGLPLLAAADGPGGHVRGSGKSATEARQVAEFDEVSVASGIRVELAVGPRTVEVTADDNIVPLVVTKVKEGRALSIGYARNTSISTSGPVLVKVTAPALKEVSASGGARAQGKVAKAERLALEASGGAEVALEGLEAGLVDAQVSGGGALRLSGSAGLLKLEASGGARVDTRRLEAKRVTLEASGGVNAEVRASEEVTGEASGGTRVTVAGKARTRVESSGASRVRQEE